MAQSLISSSGSTINHWCSQGSGNAVPTLIQEMPLIRPAVSVPITVTTFQSGTTFLLGVSTAFGGSAIVLPDPTVSAGCKWRFVASDTAGVGNGWDINDPTSTLYGSAIVGPSGGTALVIGNGNFPSSKISFAASTALVGDWIEIMSNGVNMFCSGQSQATGGILIA